MNNKFEIKVLGENDKIVIKSPKDKIILSIEINDDIEDQILIDFMHQQGSLRRKLVDGLFDIICDKLMKKSSQNFTKED